MSQENEIGNKNAKKIVTSDKMGLELEKFDKDYKSISTSTSPNSVQDVNPQSSGFLARKYRRVKKALGEFWVVGKHGFKFGFMAGGALGFLLGLYESLKMKSFLPLPLAVIGSGCTFGFIFAISTVVRSKSDTNEEILFEIGYFKDGNFFSEKLNCIDIHKI